MTRIQSFSLLGAAVALLVIAWLSADRERPSPSLGTSANAPVPAPRPAGERVVSSLEPDGLFAALDHEPKWKELVASGNPFSFTYTQRPFGDVLLDDVRLGRASDGFQVRAGAFSMSSNTWRDVSFSLRRRVETIELRQEPSADFKPLEINYTSGRAAALWAFTLPHQSARALLAHYAPELAPEDERTQLLVNLSVVVPHAAEKPVSGNLEVVLDAWPKPDWPDTKALLGDTLSLGGRVEPAESGSMWRLEDVRVSTLLFTLNGKGHIEWRRSPALLLDASGSLTCRQLGANLAPSVYLDEVKQFLASASASAQTGKVELKLHVDVDVNQGRREVAWRLAGGCGLAER